MRSTKIFYLLFPLMVFGLMMAPAIAATVEYSNLENAPALSSQNRASGGGSPATDMLTEALIFAKGPGGGGSGGGGNGGGSGGGGNDGSGGGSGGGSGSGSG
ncbi:MAG: hypothetical protein PVG59_19620, partial [Desulfobacterales bacterium]